MPAVADPTATGAYTSRQLAQAIKDEDAEASDWFKPESEQETVPNPLPRRPIRVTGFTMNTNETEIPAARSSRSILAGLATVAIAAVAVAGCAGITIGLPTVGWLSGLFGGDEPEVVAEASPPVTDQGPVAPAPVIVDAPVDVVLVPDPAATIAVVDDDPIWLRCAPPTDDRPSPTYKGGKLRVFLAMLNTQSVNHREHMEVWGLSGRPICVAGPTDDFEIVENATLGIDGVCVVDTSDDGETNPTPQPNLHVEWLCSDKVGKLASTSMFETNLQDRKTPVPELTDVMAKCCDDGGVDNACKIRPEPKTEIVASNP
jgi:hypothetical protein